MTNDYTEAAIRRLLSEDSAVADLAIEISRHDNLVVLSGEVESAQRRDEIIRLVRMHFPHLTLRHDIAVSRYHEPVEAEDLA